MQARRTIEHGPEAGWSSVAVHLAPAGPAKEGFYLTLFPDARPPTVVFLRPAQLSQLIDLAGQAQITDQQIWDVVAKIPMEPLLPSRSLYPRLRALLVDCASSLRASIREQQDRPVPRGAPIDEEMAATHETGFVGTPEPIEPPERIEPIEPAGGGDPDRGGSDLP